MQNVHSLDIWCLLLEAAMREYAAVSIIWYDTTAATVDC